MKYSLFLFVGLLVLNGCSKDNIDQTDNVQTTATTNIELPTTTHAVIDSAMSIESDNTDGISIVLHNPEQENIQSVQIVGSTQIPHTLTQCSFSPAFPLQVRTTVETNNIALEFSTPYPVNAKKIRLMSCKKETNTSLILACDSCKIITDTGKEITKNILQLQ